MARTNGAHTRHTTEVHGRAKAWQSMRILKRFTTADMETTAGLTATNAQKFIKRLRAAGYLRVAQERVSGRPGSYTLYALIRDSGPKCPVLWENGQVYDLNLKQAFGEARE